MQKLILSDLYEPFDDVFHDLCNISLCDPFSLFEVGTEIPFVTELSDYIAMRGFSDHVIALEDVRMFQLRECLDLTI